MTPAERIRRAVKLANLPRAAADVVDVLAARTDWLTGYLPADRQPVSVAQLAGWAGCARSSAERGLDVAERFGWLERKRPAGPLRRGVSVTYQVRLGRARPKERTPMTDAERARRYRERKRTGPAVTDSQRHDQTGTYDGAARHDQIGTYVTPNAVTTSQVSEDLTPLAGWGREFRDGNLQTGNWRNWPAGSNGAAMNTDVEPA